MTISISDKILEIERKRRSDIKEISEKANNEKQKLFAQCDHVFNDWRIKRIGDTNCKGEYFERRQCQICGMGQSRIKGS